MKYISSDTNVWLDFATIIRLEIPFKLPYTYIMNEDAIEDELLSPKELRENLVRLGLQAVELSEEEFYKRRQSTTFISVRWAWVNAALLLLLILNVFFYHCQAVFTYRCNEVAV